MGYRIAIVGGGIMGLASAYSLIKRGVRDVIVLERHEIGHDRAASTDRTKALRYEYAGAEMYSLMTGRAEALWRDLEAAGGTELYVNCGVMCWGTGETSHAAHSYRTLDKLGMPVRQVSAEELQARYPQFDVSNINYATLNPYGGFLRASECIAVLARAVRAGGATVREQAQVTGLEQTGDGVTVMLADGERVRADQALISTGAWGAKLLPQLGVTLPMTANRQQVVYVGGLGEEFSPSRFPVFLNLDHDFYGFPLDDSGKLKASIHYPGPVIDPEAIQSPDPAYEAEVIALLDAYIPRAARGELAGSRMCMYDMTPDEDFVLDRLPGREKIAVALGFSGHGFKFAPLIGEMMADLLLDRQTEFPLDRFALARFHADMAVSMA